MNSEEIMVEILDLSGAEAHVLRTYKEQMSSDPASSAFDVDYDNVFDMHITRAVARYISPQGDVYVLVEGIRGVIGPITKDHPLHLGVKKRLHKGEDPHRILEDTYVTLFEEDIRHAQSVFVLDVQTFLELNVSHSASITEKLREVP